MLVPQARAPDLCYHLSLTKLAVVFPIAQTLTFLSSPPVTRTPAVFRPIRTQRTSPACAANSTAYGIIAVH